MADASSWPEVRLGDVARRITVGHVGPMADQYQMVGIPFLRSLNVAPYRIDRNDLKFVSRKFHEQLAKSALRPGDVVVVRTGRPGTAAVVPENLPEANCSDLVVITPSDGLDARFLAYYLNSAAGRANVDGRLVGSVQAHFNIGDARRLRLRVPPISIQRAIADTLGALDDKIELNRRMNQTLEAIARAIFKSWFVDFDPVRAKMEGHEPPGMDSGTAALFPDSLVDSTLGRIPFGWKVADVYEVADIRYGAPYASGLFNSNRDGMPLIRIRDLATHEPSIYTTETHPRDVVIEPGDVVVGMDGEFDVHIWRGLRALLNQRVCTFRPKHGVPPAFVTEVVREPLKFFEGSKSGTTVTHLGKADIDTIRIMVPSREVLRAFGELTAPTVDEMVANAAEVRTLADLRDALLPRLVSGKLRPSFPSDGSHPSRKGATHA